MESLLAREYVQRSPGGGYGIPAFFPEISVRDRFIFYAVDGGVTTYYHPVVSTESYYTSEGGVWIHQNLP